MHITKTRMRDWIRDLRSLECCFWACDGPNKPFEHMVTCRKCAVVIEMREALKNAEVKKQTV